MPSVDLRWISSVTISAMPLRRARPALGKPKCAVGFESRPELERVPARTAPGTLEQVSLVTSYTTSENANIGFTRSFSSFVLQGREYILCAPNHSRPLDDSVRELSSQYGKPHVACSCTPLLDAMKFVIKARDPSHLHSPRSCA
jgi:hypothetical protein